LFTEASIVENSLPIVRHAEAPINADLPAQWWKFRVMGRSKFLRVNRLVIRATFVGCANRFEHVAS
jgi:hypothetical protein